MVASIDALREIVIKGFGIEHMALCENSHDLQLPSRDQDFLSQVGIPRTDQFSCAFGIRDYLAVAGSSLAFACGEEDALPCVELCRSDYTLVVACPTGAVYYLARLHCDDISYANRGVGEYIACLSVYQQYLDSPDQGSLDNDVQASLINTLENAIAKIDSTALEFPTNFWTITCESAMHFD